MSSGYALHPDAFADLEEIREYMAQDNPEAADRVIEEIFEAFRALVAFPQRGFKRPELTSRPLRFAVVRSYLVAYAPNESPLWIIAVTHGRRSPRTIASILGGRVE